MRINKILGGKKMTLCQYKNLNDKEYARVLKIKLDKLIGKDILVSSKINK